MASVNDRYPAGELTITGECEARHKDEIVHLARHQEEQEKAEYPRHRIVPSRSSIALIVVQTIDIHPAAADRRGAAPCLPRRAGFPL